MTWHDQYRAKAKKWAQLLGCLPGVEAIFLSGSLAQGRANRDSDIDFFIIARQGRIWTARFWIFVVLKLCGQLAKPHHHRGRICPNHLITDESLEIAEKDAYAANLFAHNTPLYDPRNLFHAFQIANHGWITDYREHWSHTSTKNETKTSPKTTNIITSALEKFFRAVQKWKINPKPNPYAKIILTDTELRFHPNPRSRTFKKS